VAIGIGIVRDGYILVNGTQSREVSAIATAVGTPLLGVAVGLALFFLIPKVRSTADKDTKVTRP
jgi:phosphate/sulfate permease